MIVRVLRIAITVVVALSFANVALGQRAPAKADPDKPKIRAITAFVNLDRTQYQPQIADAVKMLKYARTVYESRGYEVTTIRIATQPFPEYTQGADDRAGAGVLPQLRRRRDTREIRGQHRACDAGC